MANASLAAVPYCKPALCVPCYLGASVVPLSFPYTVRETVTVDVTPYASVLPNGRTSTWYSTATETLRVYNQSGSDAIFTDGVERTWVVEGSVTLTSPTTYAQYTDFFGAPAVPIGPYECAELSDISALTFPAATEAASLITALPAKASAHWVGDDVRPIPQQVLQYVGSLEDVLQQLDGEAPSSCDPFSVIDGFPSRPSVTTDAPCIITTTTCVTLNVSTLCETATSTQSPVEVTSLPATSQPPAASTVFHTPARALSFSTGPTIWAGDGAKKTKGTKNPEPEGTAQQIDKPSSTTRPGREPETKDPDLPTSKTPKETTADHTDGPQSPQSEGVTGQQPERTTNRPHSFLSEGVKGQQPERTTDAAGNPLPSQTGEESALLAGSAAQSGTPTTRTRDPVGGYIESGLHHGSPTTASESSSSGVAPATGDSSRMSQEGWTLGLVVVLGCLL
ncbi:uncharacterized protein LTR77_006947 [Saxophila tyrrhenica]|uniref:Uncharacterized protein n=1 Tax=Saxophila tyrrhenica TaxID=1690608 RepID=A0AAV9P6D4_9PEZI|nr:hypothetical protein LTR77_006947 [Saxophila tyrrhenica]